MTVFAKFAEIAITAGGARKVKISPEAAVDQDLNINGDVADEFVDALCDEFGNWIAEWPWRRFVDFNEPPASFGPWLWKLLGIENGKAALPGYTEERLPLGQIAAVIEKGEWFDP